MDNLRFGLVTHGERSLAERAQANTLVCRELQSNAALAVNRKRLRRKTIVCVVCFTVRTCRISRCLVLERVRHFGQRCRQEFRTEIAKSCASPLAEPQFQLGDLHPLLIPEKHSLVLIKQTSTIRIRRK